MLKVEVLEAWYNVYDDTMKLTVEFEQSDGPNYDEGKSGGMVTYCRQDIELPLFVVEALMRCSYPERMAQKIAIPNVEKAKWILP